MTFLIIWLSSGFISTIIGYYYVIVVKKNIDSFALRDMLLILIGTIFGFITPVFIINLLIGWDNLFNYKLWNRK